MAHILLVFVLFQLRDFILLDHHLLWVHKFSQVTSGWCLHKDLVVDISSISYKYHEWFHTLRTWFQLPGLESQSISVLKHCIPIVYRPPSTVSVYPKSMLQPHYVQSIRIDSFFVKIACTSLILILMMFIVNSWKNLKISKKNWNFGRCTFWAWRWLTIFKRCKKRIKISKKPAKPVNTRRNQKKTRQEPDNWQIWTESTDLYGFYFRLWWIFVRMF